eukprot:g72130.t1
MRSWGNGGKMTSGEIGKKNASMIPYLSSNDSKRYLWHSETILQAQLQLKQANLVVKDLDKNKNQLWVECQYLYWARGFKEIITQPCFTITLKTPEDVLQQYASHYNEFGLKKFGPYYSKGTIPTAIFTQKDKDPIYKTRLLNNQAKSPHRYILKPAAKALNFLIKKLCKKLKTVSKAISKTSHINKCNVNYQTLQFDVKQMFT